MKRLFRSPMMSEVGLVRGLLEQAGIACLVKNERLSGALGDIPFLECEPELWVLNEADLSKIYARQKCRVSPEAFPDKVYDGYVAEISPEADRSKGTLEIKVQVEKPDRFLTPELSARVDFLQ